MHRTNRRPKKTPQCPETPKLKPFKQTKFVVHKPPPKKIEMQDLAEFIDPKQQCGLSIFNT